MGLETPREIVVPFRGKWNLRDIARAYPIAESTLPALHAVDIIVLPIGRQANIFHGGSVRPVKPQREADQAASIGIDIPDLNDLYSEQNIMVGSVSLADELRGIKDIVDPNEVVKKLSFLQRRLLRARGRKIQESPGRAGKKRLAFEELVLRSFLDSDTIRGIDAEDAEAHWERIQNDIFAHANRWLGHESADNLMRTYPTADFPSVTVQYQPNRDFKLLHFRPRAAENI